MPTLNIDRVEITVPEGTTILEAANKAGIWIPTLCYYPKTSPSDSCRMCVVEIEGVRRPMTSCNTIAAEGMMVHTDSPKLRSIREEVMGLVLMDHPLDCPVCSAAGECEIQNLTYRLGIYGTEYQMERRTRAVVNDWPLIRYDPNLCLTCLRCVKVCHEVIGASALRLADVGYAARITTRDGGILDCDFCGECVQACPSGAMSDKVSLWARPWELRKVPTVCSLCSAGCRMLVNVKDNRIYRVTTDIESHNGGTLCVGGRFGFDFVHHEDRILTPLLRKDDELKPASWADALQFTAENLEKIIRESGPESVVGLVSPRLTNEDCYAFQKFFRTVIGTNNIDSEARFSILRVQRALELTCGVGGSSGRIEDLLETDAIFLIGVDPLEETPAIGWKVKIAARRYDSNVIVANSRKTSLDRFSRVLLRVRPYSESDLVLGLMKIILDLDLWDKEFVRDRTANFLPMKNLLDKISLNGILKRTGIAREDLQEAARILGEAPRASIVFGGDVILQENGLQCVMNIANLALLTGNIGQSNAGIYPIFEKGNMVGLCDMGALPEYLPGYQHAAQARELFEKVWKNGIPYTKGRTVPEMVHGLENGDVRAVYIAGADPLTDYPHSTRLAKALRKAELLVVHEIFPSPTALMAHCVFPASSFAEKNGTITNFEHRVQKINQAIAPLGESMPDWSILEEVAKAMGKSMGFSGVEDIFSEMSRTLPFYDGLNISDLDGDGKIAIPLHQDHGRSRSGKPYSFAPVRTWECPEGPEAEAYPFEMIAGRSMFHFGSTSTRSKNLLTLCPRGYVEINPQDAVKLNISENQPIEVSSPVSSFCATARISDKVSREIVYVPSNFPDLRVYSLFRENTTICRVRLTPLNVESPCGEETRDDVSEATARVLTDTNCRFRLNIEPQGGLHERTRKTKGFGARGR
ncbi:molybdopterin-dependent oxidoreductase [Desulfomonile tiedjei]|uniref:Putative anaerobic dehydrogenase n=1 Tax=Desulfomonile tiedjei (strain ATCC 49306 / DSM 6799 / DCB-1) TaxID=706587 RepID=I4C7Q9_DESTA|nr:molybdopterin-dependent oxidoreductase [Desulfomonile tiedjei]AFM25600.1 putative anaerobic dehydrogenase [Desulfomonile tiedjei DSM 6799]